MSRPWKIDLVREMRFGRTWPRCHPAAALCHGINSRGWRHAHPLGGRRALWVVGSLATSLGTDVGDESPKSHVIFKSDAITNVLTRWIRIIGYLGPVVVGNVHEILKEGFHME